MFGGLREASREACGPPRAPAGRELAVASGVAVRYKPDGAELERFRATHLLKSVPDGWRVAVLAAHDPDTVRPLR